MKNRRGETDFFDIEQIYRPEKKSKIRKTARRLGHIALGVSVVTSVAVYTYQGPNIRYSQEFGDCEPVETTTDDIDDTVGEIVDAAIEERLAQASDTPDLYSSPGDVYIDDLVADAIGVEWVDEEAEAISRFNASSSYDELVEITSELAEAHNLNLLVGTEATDYESVYELTPYTDDEYDAVSPLHSLGRTLRDLPRNYTENIPEHITLRIVEAIEQDPDDSLDIGGYMDSANHDMVLEADLLRSSEASRWRPYPILQHELAHYADYVSGCQIEDPQYEALEEEATSEMRANGEGVGEIFFSEYGATATHEDKSVAHEYMLSGLTPPGIENSAILEEKYAILTNRLHDYSPETAEWMRYCAHHEPNLEETVAESEAWQEYREEQRPAPTTAPR